MDGDPGCFYRPRRSGDPKISILEAEKSRVGGLKSKHKLSATRKMIKTLTIRQLAEDFKLEQEYQSLYKLFSNLVGPPRCASLCPD
jgi:hypothetical protein